MKDSFQTNVYKKSTQTNCCLNFYSIKIISIKNGVTSTRVNRATDVSTAKEILEN